MIRITRAALEAARYAFKPGARSVARAAFRDATRRRTPQDARKHLEATVQWLFSAHDAADKGGVSRSYTLRFHHNYKRTGWLPAYPETTGYIVPTLYRTAEVLELPEAAERAERMARWEAEVQMETGAVQGGTIVDEPTPAIFNTGQVLFGWVKAAEVTGDSVFRDAAARASRWLLEMLDDDGGWRRGVSKFAKGGPHVYNARAAWGLARYGQLAGDKDALEGARHSAEFALSHQHENGWYSENCLTDVDHPLTHTIAYAAQGVLEIGLILDDDRFVESARKVARALHQVQRRDGFLAGRYDHNWRPSATWSCLTGNAQMALVWDRLAELDGEPSFRDSADRAVAYDCSTQILDSDDGGVRGGLAGSYPIWGGYGTYEYLNWAAKFLADALLSRVTGKPEGWEG